jgi:hypothetical protein
VAAKVAGSTQGLQGMQTAPRIQTAHPIPACRGLRLPPDRLVAHRIEQLRDRHIVAHVHDVGAALHAAPPLFFR